MEDRQIVQLYLARDEKALLETKGKYGAYCHSLAWRILNNDADAEEVVNDTWLRAWNSIPPKQPVALRSFLAKITRNLALNRHRDQTAQKRGGGEVELALEELNECIPSLENVHDALEGRELTGVIHRFLQTQSRRDRSIFLARYFSVESIGCIARRHSLTEANTRKILSRTREKLRDYLSKEGYLI